jgi:hypothetical protein
MPKIKESNSPPKSRRNGNLQSENRPQRKLLLQFKIPNPHQSLLLSQIHSLLCLRQPQIQFLQIQAPHWVTRHYCLGVNPSPLVTQHFLLLESRTLTVIGEMELLFVPCFTDSNQIWSRWKMFNGRMTSIPSTITWSSYFRSQKINWEFHFPRIWVRSARLQIHKWSRTWPLNFTFNWRMNPSGQVLQNWQSRKLSLNKAWLPNVRNASRNLLSMTR